MRFEITYLVLAALSLGFAWYFHVKQNNKIAISLLILGGALLRVYMASDAYLHAWDERYHALVAKNMMENPFKPMLFKDPILGIHRFNWTTNHIWLHKQPFPLWCMAGSMKIFGISEFSLRIPSLLISTASIWFTYDLAKRLFSIQAAFFAAFLFAIQGFILEVGAGRVPTDHIDLFFLSLVLIAVWSAHRYSENDKFIFNLICGITIGLAILTKWLPALIVIPVWALFQYKIHGFNFRKILPRLIVLLFVTCLIALPWQLYIRSAFPLEQAWESSFNFRHITETLDRMGGPFYFHFDKMRIVYGELVYIPLIWFIYYSLKTRKSEYFALLIWLLIPYLFFSITKTKMQGYTLFTAPALLLICGVFWKYLLGQLTNVSWKKWLAVVILTGLVALPVRYSIERIKPLSPGSQEPSWVSDLKDLKENLPKNEKVVLLNVHNYVESMFYTDATTYNYIPSDGVIDSLLSEGYSVYMNHTSDVMNKKSGVNYFSITPSPY